MATRVEITPGLPDPATFAAFRAAEGWGRIGEEQAYLALAGSQFGVVARVEGRIIGFGRATGDGALSLYIEDLIVDQGWRGRGVGGRILEALLARADQVLPPGAMIALLAAEGVERFYEAHGFTRRPGPGYGAAMMRLIAGARH